jgi:hypothetical protein
MRACDLKDDLAIAKSDRARQALTCVSSSKRVYDGPLQGQHCAAIVMSYVDLVQECNLWIRHQGLLQLLGFRMSGCFTKGVDDTLRHTLRSE